MKNKSLFDQNKVVVDNTYTRRLNVPQYTPIAVKPSIHALTNITKYSQLVHNIKESNVSEEEKAFLMMAAARHIVFNYSLIADYYAHADKEMQELMEQSALVILDFDDAIANGYVVLGESIAKLLKESGEVAGSEK